MPKKASKKPKGWEKRLEAFLLKRLKIPFKWFENDCCMFACDGIKEMTEVDPAAWFRSHPYENGRQAYRRIKKFSGGGLPEMAEKITRQLGYIEVDTPYFGDVVLMRAMDANTTAKKISYSVTIGLVCYNDFVTAPGSEGLSFFKKEDVEILKVWRI